VTGPVPGIVSSAGVSAGRVCGGSVLPGAVVRRPGIHQHDGARGLGQHCASDLPELGSEWGEGVRTPENDEVRGPAGLDEGVGRVQVRRVDPQRYACGQVAYSIERREDFCGRPRGPVPVAARHPDVLGGVREAPGVQHVEGRGSRPGRVGTDTKGAGV
jgi:hypothetical protein